ncbi:MAG: hypothetical protein ACTHZ5_03610 [Micrococcaceae bacterium]
MSTSTPNSPENPSADSASSARSAPTPRPHRVWSRWLVVGLGLLLAAGFLVALWGLASGVVRALVGEHSPGQTPVVSDAGGDLAPGTGWVQENREQRGAALAAEYRRMAGAGETPPAVTTLTEAVTAAQQLSCESTTLASVQTAMASTRALDQVGELSAARADSPTAVEFAGEVTEETASMSRALQQWVPSECWDEAGTAFQVPERPDSEVAQLLPGLTDQWIRVWVTADSEQVETVARNGLWQATVLEELSASNAPDRQ